LLFVDEIHRFNRAQQDAFLPHLEDGTVTLVGATTENPAFAVNAAVLSRARVVRLEALDEAALSELLIRALRDRDRGLGTLGLEPVPAAIATLARAARGDARRALGLLEVATTLIRPGASHLDEATVTAALDEPHLLHDRAGDAHHDVTSALIKSMRGTDPDAAVYYLMRLIDAGEDPAFVLRRLVIFASEDVGNADPRALPLAMAADQAYHRLGMPEGLYPIAHACLYLASCPKSGAVGRAFGAARELVREHGALAVPMHLRNAPTAVHRDLGAAEGYRFPHDYPGSYVPGETYLPEPLTGRRLYEPGTEGLEANIRERLARLRARGRGE
ncbi:MAG: replication-associated recombination protein A, partial [Deltaproteobacteria bacterium]|nr:replication-associated recombination protein A [Deltaproteobacteria bacterium]